MGYKISILLFLICSSAAYLYYKDSQESLHILTADNAKLSTALTISEESVTALQNSFNENAEKVRGVNETFQEIRIRQHEKDETLSRHDIGYLAQMKPDLVQRIINSSSELSVRCYEIIGGSPLTEKERKASNAKEFNKECPELWPGHGGANSASNHP
jgi:hypothetical protein